MLRSRDFFRLASQPDHVGSWSSVGEGLDVDRLTRGLDEALITPSELLAGRDLWRSWADPFLVWPALDHGE